MDTGSTKCHPSLACLGEIAIGGLRPFPVLLPLCLWRKLRAASAAMGKSWTARAATSWLPRPGCVSVFRGPNAQIKPQILRLYWPANKPVGFRHDCTSLFLSLPFNLFISWQNSFLAGKPWVAGGWRCVSVDKSQRYLVISKQPFCRPQARRREVCWEVGRPWENTVLTIEKRINKVNQQLPLCPCCPHPSSKRVSATRAAEEADIAGWHWYWNRCFLTTRSKREVQGSQHS